MDTAQRKQLYEMYGRGETNALDNLYEIEDVAVQIAMLQKKLGFYKEFKKKKTEQIENAINIAENKVKFFKKLIVKTLQKNKENSVSFPGTCKVTGRKAIPKWVIADEDAFIEILKEENEIDKITEKVESYKILKDKANVLLETWNKNGKLEELIGIDKESSPCVIREPGEPSVAITFEESVLDDNIEDVEDETTYDVIA